jgi:hypothetical protein
MSRDRTAESVSASTVAAMSRPTLLRAFAALLAGANRLSALRFFIFNAAGGIVWATMFGSGGYLLGAGIRRIAGPVGWGMLTVALIVGFILWRYYKKHEESLLATAERKMAQQGPTLIERGPDAG